jgi:hypothetical protein
MVKAGKPIEGQTLHVATPVTGCAVDAVATDDILVERALAIRAGGVSIIPADHADKRPLSRLLPRDPETGCGAWKPFTEAIVDEECARGWFTGGARACAVIGGAVSGGLTVIDFNEARFYEPWRQAVGHLADALPVERSPRDRGGYHVFFRQPNAAGNAKLAWIPDDAEDAGRRCAIETRGEGGYCVVSPSLHPSGQRYELLSGDLANIPTVTREVADALLNAARKLCEAPYTRQQLEAMKRREAAGKRSSRNRTSANGTASVIDEWNKRQTIEQALAAHGYTPGVRGMWSRPGRDQSRVSVTVREGRSFHHSTNDILSDGYWHDPFDILCAHDRGGDVSAAVHHAAVQLGVDHQSQKAKAEADKRERHGHHGGEQHAAAAAHLVPIPFGQLARENPELPEPVIEGFGRAGNVLGIVSGSKRGKTWTAHGIALCVASGEPWLGKFPVKRGRVLIIDTELHKGGLVDRLNRITQAMSLRSEQWEPYLDLIPLRGVGATVETLAAWSYEVEPDRYTLIIIDALYKLWPKGLDENGNADVAFLMGRIECVARETGAMILVIHHAPKGNTSGRSAIDMGTGAGSFARSVDGLIGFREHENPAKTVMEAEVRYFAKPDPLCLDWDFPRWRIDPNGDPSKLKRPNRGGRPPKGDTPPKPEPKVWTPEAFGGEFIGSTPKPKELILARATAGGMTEREAARLLLLAEDKGLAHRHKIPGDLKAHYADRDPVLTDISLSHTQPPTPTVRTRRGERRGAGK